MSSFPELTFAFRRYWKVILAAAVVGAFIGVSISLVFPIRSIDSATATARVYVLSENGSKELQKSLEDLKLHTAVGEILLEIEPPDGPTFTSDTYTKSRIPTYLGILNSDATRSAVAAAVGLEPYELEDRVTIEQRDQANILDIRVTGATAAMASETLEEYARQLAQRISSIEDGGFTVEMLGTSTIGPVAEAGGATQSVEDSNVGEELIQRNPGWLTTAPLDPQLADSVAAETVEQAAGQSLDIGSATSLSILPEPAGDSTATAVGDDPNPSSPTSEIWVVQATASTEQQAQALGQAAVQTLASKQAAVHDSQGAIADRVVVGDLRVESLTTEPLPGRGATDAVVTNIALGTLVGAVLGLLFALLRVNVAPVIRTTHQVARFVGSAPHLIRKPESTDARVGPQQDLLLIAMSLKSVLNEGCSLFIAPASPADATTDIAFGIANAFHALEIQACVVEIKGDTRPTIHVFTRSAEATSFQRDSDQEARFKNHELPFFGQVQMGELRTDFSCVIVAGQSLGSSTGSLLIAGMTEGVFITATYAATKLRDYAATVASVKQSNMTLLGTVVREVPEKDCTEWRAHSIVTHVPNQ